VFTGDHRTVSAYGQMVRVWDTFFLPVDGTEAVKTVSSSLIFKRLSDTQNDPTEPRVAFFTIAETVTGPMPAIGLYDPDLHDARVLAVVPSFDNAIWSGDEIIIGPLSKPTVRVDLNTGLVSRAGAVREDTTI